MKMMTDDADALARQQQQEQAAAHNSPAAFDALPPAERAALRLWVRLTLTPTATYGPQANRWHSYTLKHHAEAALGWYVGNGALKGAMLAEGYTPRDPAELNWTFKVRRRCPHRMRGSGRKGTRHFACPLADRYTGALAAPPFPSLCQATAEELAAFDTLRQCATDDCQRQLYAQCAARDRARFAAHARRPGAVTVGAATWDTSDPVADAASDRERDG